MNSSSEEKPKIIKKVEKQTVGVFADHTLTFEKIRKGLVILKIV